MRCVGKRRHVSLRQHVRHAAQARAEDAQAGGRARHADLELSLKAAQRRGTDCFGCCHCDCDSDCDCEWGPRV
eukprot:364211-Chlamydomonas_euryale.AAC.1